MLPILTCSASTPFIKVQLRHSQLLQTFEIIQILSSILVLDGQPEYIIDHKTWIRPHTVDAVLPG